MNALKYLKAMSSMYKPKGPIERLTKTPTVVKLLGSSGLLEQAAFDVETSLNSAVAILEASKELSEAINTSDSRAIKIAALKIHIEVQKETERYGTGNG